MADIKYFISEKYFKPGNKFFVIRDPTWGFGTTIPSTELNHYIKIGHIDPKIITDQNLRTANN
jgi:hypothetical protein